MNDSIEIEKSVMRPCQRLIIFEPTHSIISVEAHQYQANLTPIETEES